MKTDNLSITNIICLLCNYTIYIICYILFMVFTIDYLSYQNALDNPKYDNKRSTEYKNYLYGSITSIIFIYIQTLWYTKIISRHCFGITLSTTIFTSGTLLAIVNVYITSTCDFRKYLTCPESNTTLNNDIFINVKLWIIYTIIGIITIQCIYTGILLYTYHSQKYFFYEHPVKEYLYTMFFYYQSGFLMLVLPIVMFICIFYGDNLDTNTCLYTDWSSVINGKQKNRDELSIDESNLL